MSQLIKQFKTDIQSILTIADEQLVAAQIEDWEKVEDLEKGRQKLIIQTLDNTLEPQLYDIARASILRIQSREQKLKTLTENAQSSTRDQLKKLQTGDKATKAYKQFL